MTALRPVTLITGASAGIGAALARVFASRGHELVLVARREAKLAAVADSVTITGQTRPHLIPLDLTSPDAGDRLANELRGKGLAPEFVVNNAGFGLVGPAAELDRAEQLAIIDLNVRLLTDLSLRFLDSVERTRGGILNVGSVAGFVPGPNSAVYHASKAYVLSFSEALHWELKPKGVRVTALCPGPVETEFQARAHMPSDYFPRVLKRSAERVARDGYEGLMRGQRLVVPGFANKVATVLPRILPRSLALRLAGGNAKAAPT
jgi:short-subunit dehydrogenase